MTDKQASKTKRNSLPILAVCVVVAVIIGGGWWYYLSNLGFESTDDAFIDSHATQVAPRVSGNVARVEVNDNQMVEVCDILVTIDPAVFQAVLDQAVASQNVAQA